MSTSKPLRHSDSERRGPPARLVVPVLGLAAVGALVLVPMVLLTAIPVLFALALVCGGLVALVLFTWAGIELLAAFERWLEQDPRFHQ